MTTTTQGGIVLTVNGKDVWLSTTDINRVRGGAVHYKLDEPLVLGSAADLKTFLNDTFGADLSIDASSFPFPLDEVYSKLTSLNLTLTELALTVPATDEQQTKEASFSLGLSATWSDDQAIHILPRVLAVKGIFVKVVKDEQKTQSA
jgi:hypothetical protein